jgi:hypothetical protein
MPPWPKRWLRSERRELSVGLKHVSVPGGSLIVIADKHVDLLQRGVDDGSFYDETAA